MMKNCKRGSVLVLALLLSTLIVTITFTLVSVNSKEITRQNILSGSYKAFNIADIALECVLYYDIRLKRFSNTDFGDPEGTIYCPQENLDDSIPVVSIDLYSFDIDGNEYAIEGHRLSDDPMASCIEYKKVGQDGEVDGEEYSCTTKELYQTYSNRYNFFLAPINQGVLKSGEPCAQVIYTFEKFKDPEGFNPSITKKYIDIIGYDSCQKIEGVNVQTGNVYRTLTLSFF